MSEKIVRPSKFWKSMCSASPLSKIAAAILDLPCTSAGTERTFSTHGWIHSAKRNRLTAKRAGKITYISHNLKLLDKKSKVKINPEQGNATESDEEEDDDIDSNELRFVNASGELYPVLMINNANIEVPVIPESDNSDSEAD